MKPNTLKNIILSLTSDLSFEYNNKTALINPWSENKIEVCFGEKVKTYHEINELMEDPLFDGQSLKNICNDLEIYQV